MLRNLQEFWAWGDGIVKAIVFSLLICAAFWIVAAVLKRKIVPKLIDWTAKNNHHPVANALLRGFQQPSVIYLRLAGVAVALIALSGWLSHEWIPKGLQIFLGALPAMLYKTLRVAAIVAVAWGLIASSGVTAQLFRNARHRLDLHMSQSVSRFLSAVINVVVLMLATAMILNEFNFDINGLIAGLGLGGLTVALAAKESASNFFGGLVLITEKPFEIGDWIVCGGVEGTVEDINLRSTKVRTSAGSLTVVPNSVLSGAPITNWSSVMEKRRADFTLQLVYGTSKKQMQEYVAATQTLLETDPDVLSDSITVRFSDFGESSLNLRVIFYTALPGFGDHLRIKERINYGLMDLAQRLDIEFAFPSRSVYLQMQSPNATPGGDPSGKASPLPD